MLVTATYQPTAMWLAQQIIEAFPWDTANRFLIGHNDAKLGLVFIGRLKACGIHDRPIAPRKMEMQNASSDLDGATVWITSSSGM